MRPRHLVLAAASALAGCAASTEVVRLYQDPAFGGEPFAKLLVVGVHEDATVRRRFEDAVAASLRAAGTDATASVVAMGAERELSRDTLVAAAQTSGSDAVLVTRLLDVERRAEVGGGRATAEPERRNDVPIADFFRYDYVEYQDPMTVTTVSTVVLATDLYDAGTEAKVWSAESTAFEKETVYDVVTDVSAALTARLRRDGLVE